MSNTNKLPEATMNAATCITGDRQRAERMQASEKRMQAATCILRLLNDGWTMTPNERGYILTPPQQEQRR